MKYISYGNADGYLYCVREDAVRHGALLDCFNCPYFNGSLQGTGRECVVAEDSEITFIEDPYAYMDSKSLVKEEEVE